MIKVEKLNPFGRMCVSLGMLPSSYKESLTYEEQLLWFCNYLTETVIPTVNNNAEAVEELQALYTQIKTYVDEYFDNLDVQEEINNKLDDMAESGELTDIIAQYLGLAGVLAYDTVADMKVAENLVNGSICSTLGYHSINDGGSAKYKIRNITNDDIVDEMSIIALADPNLIAEIIVSNVLNIRQFGGKDDGVTDNTSILNSAFNYCYENKCELYIPTGNFIFNTPLSITNLPNIKMNGNLKFTGNSNDYALILGDNSNEQNNLNLEFMLSCEKSTTNKGLKLININNSNIKLKYIYGFGTGVTLNGNNKGFCYNKIDCYNIYNNNIGLEIQPTGTGWVNENLFLNGNFKYSNQLDKTGTIGIKMSGGTDNYTNNNMFIKPSFEQLDKAVTLTKCANNTFKQCRCEKVDMTLTTDNLSRINEFEIGYGNIVYDINNETTILKTQAMKPLLTPTKVYDIKYNDNTTFETTNDTLYMNTNNYCIMHSGGSTSKSIAYDNNFLLSNNYLKQLVTQKAIGIFIKTDVLKDFYARKQTLFNEPGRWFLRCYDENKAVISNLGDNFNESSEGLMKYNDINNGYRTLSDLNHDIFIHLPENVKYIFFGITRVGTPYSIKSMEIYSNGTFDWSDNLSTIDN